MSCQSGKIVWSFLFHLVIVQIKSNFIYAHLHLSFKYHFLSINQPAQMVILKMMIFVDLDSVGFNDPE